MTSKFVKISSALAATAAVGVSLLTPVAAQAGQASKNDMRNLSIGSAILAGIGLINHNSTLTTIGIAGTVIGAASYEQQRKNQATSRYDNRGWNRNDNHDRWYDRNDGSYRRDGDDRDNRDYQGWDQRDNRDNGGWNRQRDNRDNGGFNRQGDNRDNGGYRVHEGD